MTMIREKPKKKKKPASNATARAARKQSKIVGFDHKKQYSLSELEEMLTQRQIVFAKEYVRDWNKTRAARDSGYSPKTCAQIACELVKRPAIKCYINLIKEDIEQNLNLTKTKVVEEHYKIAFSTFGDINESWMELKEFDQLTPQQLACIKSVDTSEGVYGTKVKVELFSKQDSLKEIAKLMGYNQPDKITQKSEVTYAPGTIDSIREALGLQNAPQKENE